MTNQEIAEGLAKAFNATPKPDGAFLCINDKEIVELLNKLGVPAKYSDCREFLDDSFEGEF